ncbi:ribose-phosphate pyrophosphokinase [Cupriavidus pinatubonensis]|uniref:ribose-phosphate diphosphokinase n=1 Tax=Cupriavidus pinatubonensis TaxID=248026 RepID=A0ABN7ZHY3_9BURK|nr:ribose-phosphate pyrophosphokinase [Cupriavidus pinatubonensis]CAG9185582.1 Ribose-phosphate pyrophosphokinase [Cupriavidus pinatubonensis]
MSPKPSTRQVVFSMPGNERQAAALCRALHATAGNAIVRHFPDGESAVRLEADVAGRDVILVCTLDRPDAKVLPLLWLATAARENGAARTGLLAPYLPYMRQDSIFRAGEIVSARHFAALLSGHFDWLATVDPHLHRIRCLSEIFSIPTVAIHAAPAIAQWIRDEIEAPLIIGPDEESRQWVEDIAARCQATAVVLEKDRLSDTAVNIAVRNLPEAGECTPVLVDDIVSTGHTMLEAARRLLEHGYRPPVCIGVHALFAGTAYADLCAVAADVVSCDTVEHPSNRIVLANFLAAAIQAEADDRERGDPARGQPGASVRPD